MRKQARKWLWELEADLEADLGSDADLSQWEKEADALEVDEAEEKDFGEDAVAEAEADRISADDDDDNIADQEVPMRTEEGDNGEI